MLTENVITAGICERRNRVQRSVCSSNPDPLLSALPPKADIGRQPLRVRFGPNSDMQIPFWRPADLCLGEGGCDQPKGKSDWRRVREVASGAISVAPGPGR